jgi:hypothetical protein
MVKCSPPLSWVTMSLEPRHVHALPGPSSSKLKVVEAGKAGSFGHFSSVGLHVVDVCETTKGIRARSTDDATNNMMPH